MGMENGLPRGLAAQALLEDWELDLKIMQYENKKRKRRIFYCHIKSYSTRCTETGSLCLTHPFEEQWAAIVNHLISVLAP